MQAINAPEVFEKRIRQSASRVFRPLWMNRSLKVKHLYIFEYKNTFLVKHKFEAIEISTSSNHELLLNSVGFKCLMICFLIGNTHRSISHYIIGVGI